MTMITRLYVHNFRCLENFELALSDFQSALLLGRNGTGKSTVGQVLELLQKIARGTNRVGELLRPSDLTRGRTTAPARFEIEANFSGRSFKYSIAFEFPPGFRELRVLDEQLSVGGEPIFTRRLAQVDLVRA